MKLVTRDSSNEYLRQQQQLLEDNGIPAFITGENTARIIPPILMSQAGLWVYIDEQHYDANQLLLNTSHIVTTAVDVDEFYQSQPSKDEMHTLLNDSLIKSALYILMTMVGIFVLVKIIDAVTT